MTQFENEIVDGIATRLVEQLEIVERTGIRRDLLITGMERAIEKLRDNPPTKQ